MPTGAWGSPNLQVNIIIFPSMKKSETVTLSILRCHMAHMASSSKPTLQKAEAVDLGDLESMFQQHKGSSSSIVNINHVDIERLFQGHQRILKTVEDEDKHH